MLKTNAYTYTLPIDLIANEAANFPFHRHSCIAIKIVGHSFQTLNTTIVLQHIPTFLCTKQAKQVNALYLFSHLEN